MQTEHEPTLRTQPQHMPPTPSPSLNDLQRQVRAATTLKHTPYQTRYRALDAVSRGQTLLPSTLMHKVVPNVLHHSVGQYHCRVYGGRFVGADGSRFISSCQDRFIRVYDTGNSECPAAWKQTHRIGAEYVRWTITDFDVSPCGRWLAYATMNNYVHVVDLHGAGDEQETFNFSEQSDERMNIWSIKWSHDGREIIAGSSFGNGSGYGGVVVFDVQLGKIVSCIVAHDCDVNAVCFMQQGDDNLILSGSDDCLVNMWDRRELHNHRRGEKHQPCGIFIGHHQGLTHVSTKNDGRFFLSNGKDQYIKLWDARKTTPSNELRQVQRPPSDRNFDYRFHNACVRISTAASGYRDDAVVSYSGAHETLQTLIRVNFSPMRTTAQKYIYCGSSDGAWVVYDMLSGKVVQRKEHHQAPVRDVSWHPEGCFVVTSSWDGQVLLWSTYAEDDDSSDELRKE